MMEEEYAPNESIYIGNTDEIRRVYNSIYRAYMKGRFEDLYPSYFCEKNGPGKYHFSSQKSTYGIFIDYDENKVIVKPGDTMLNLILDRYLEIS